MTFQDLNLIPSILKTLKEQKYINPTPIQEKSIPLVLQGNDVLGTAQTGTGKTAAFSIPIIQHIAKNAGDQSRSKKQISALIITPTRELAIQIADNVKIYSKYTGVQSTVIFGGVNQNPQVRTLKSNQIDILIATPGRLLDLMNQGYISLKHIKYFVLDEADRMLDMGFVHDIKKLISHLPKRRQSLFFSATMPTNILNLSKDILNNPKKVSVAPVSSTADTIKQFVFMTNKGTKAALLLDLLKQPKMKQVLVFSRTKHGADKIVRNLSKKGIKCAAIHGNKSQNQRQKALKSFKSGEIQVLVATDIAARGIDIDKLQYVINYDIPNESETYVHRIGRSGRAGEQGVAYSICEPEENEYLRDIEKLINKKITVVQDNPYPQTEKPMSAAEKKEERKLKEKRKQEFFANRKKNRNGKNNSRR
ncbi:MAG: DEAD/DEAH box helicase [Flavobacteriaceae bacterium]